MNRATPEEIVSVGERVAAMLKASGVEPLLIGAAALATYGYVRATSDFDLGTAINPTPALPRLAEELRSLGFDAEYLHPDADDPLGGVLRIHLGNDAGVDVVNFENPWHGGAAPIFRDALATAAPPPAGSVVRVIPLAHLIALKLYSGGPKSLSDVWELLRLHPELDRTALRTFLARFQLDGRLP